MHELHNIIWQDSNYLTRKYTVLDVDVDCVRLSKFIETKLNCQYEDGKAFYEVTRNEEATEEDNETEKEEDLLYYKKILCLKKNEVFVMHSNKYGVIIAQGKLHFKSILL